MGTVLWTWCPEKPSKMSGGIPSSDGAPARRIRLCIRHRPALFLPAVCLRHRGGAGGGFCSWRERRRTAGRLVCGGARCRRTPGDRHAPFGAHKWISIARVPMRDPAHGSLAPVLRPRLRLCADAVRIPLGTCWSDPPPLSRCAVTGICPA
ncbi:hypothetical protein CERSUDRAFT_119798 [Gelatoporia subvermispora B]|uniref:Uncharacterized protein n=1 Tax=Ceriporiopsis subvermispora (strain B) TaxID=914234 RepID=M2P7X9_CERS8|nr:hypothetical protein CERSUDRAFT_119798 [Gelatoporia subvermispora B]